MNHLDSVGIALKGNKPMNLSRIQERRRIYIEYAAIVTATHNLPVSKIRNDQGGEYSSNEMRLWYKEKGIVIEDNISHNLSSRVSTL